jgi:DNA-binding NarL/FixJ family response regulator
VLRRQCPELAITLTADAPQVKQLLDHSVFELLVLDGALPGLDVGGVLDHLHHTRPSQRLLVLADPVALPQSGRWQLHPGVQLLLPSQVPPHTLAAALAPWLAAQPARRVQPAAMGTRFSRRELEVLRLVVDDCCNEEIANRLFINVRTVESHRRNLLQKAGTRTLVGLAAKAVREGWVA